MHIRGSGNLRIAEVLLSVRTCCKLQDGLFLRQHLILILIVSATCLKTGLIFLTSGWRQRWGCFLACAAFAASCPLLANNTDRTWARTSNQTPPELWSWDLSQGYSSHKDEQIQVLAWPKSSLHLEFFNLVLFSETRTCCTPFLSAQPSSNRLRKYILWDFVT